jgi:predicted transcriptional regulator
MKKSLISWKREYNSKEVLLYRYFKLLLIGFNDITLSDRELQVLVELNNSEYHSSKLNVVAEKVGFKHQVLKNTLTKLKKYKLVYCIKNTYSINPAIKVSDETSLIDIKCNIGIKHDTGA